MMRLMQGVVINGEKKLGAGFLVPKARFSRHITCMVREAFIPDGETSRLQMLRILYPTATGT